MLGAQCGLTPDQVLDMNITMLEACIAGYQERLFDQQCIAVQQGYWAGYYQSKKPKPVNSILDRMIREHEKDIKKKHSENKNIPKPQVDVETFLRREERRKAYIASHVRK